MPYGITQCYLPPGRGDIPALLSCVAGVIGRSWFSSVLVCEMSQSYSVGGSSKLLLIAVGVVGDGAPERDSRVDQVHRYRR